MSSGKRDASRRRQTAVQWLACGGLVLMTGCSAVSGAVGEARGASSLLGNGETYAIYGLEGRWAGPVTPTAENCGEATTGSMMIGDNGFGFDPFEGTTVINGSVSKDGTVSGTLTRTVGGGGGVSVDPGLPGPSGKPTGTPAEAAHGPHTLSISLEAKAGKGADGRMAIEGVLTSGRCTWHVALKRA